MKSRNVLVFSYVCAAMILGACGDSKSSDDAGATAENTAVLCSDGLDNDNNGLKDCEEPACQAFAFCAQAEDGKENTLTACQDKIDNDGDTLIDCDDSDCKVFTICASNPGQAVIENTVALCSDDIDNDNNGLKDCDDPNCKELALCASAEEGKENTLAACQDKIDNDGDTLIDCDDDDCKDFTICAESAAENTVEACQDHLDNDKDGKIDCDDEDCAAFSFCQKLPDGGGVDDGKSENTVAACYFDGIDNDGDTLIDCDDPNCKIFTFCQNLELKQENTLATCQDGIDNDGDGKADCLDPDCAAFIVCQPDAPKENTEELCSDGKDNDDDGNIDCLDPDCWPLKICAKLVGVAENTRELCTDGKDNDFNGKTDCEDPGCAKLDVCTSGGARGENTLALCTDGKDNDGDGKKDCEDPECAVFAACKGLAKTGENTKEACQDGKDNDGDGLIDCEDAECQQFTDICVDVCKDDPFLFMTEQQKANAKCECGQTFIDDKCFTNIATADEFKALAGKKGNYVLKAPIDFGESTQAPIEGFTGILHGGGQRISGIINQTITSKSSVGECGLFGETQSTFKYIDLAITLNCYDKGYYGKAYVGGLISSALGKIDNITGSAKVYFESVYTGSSAQPMTRYKVNVGGIAGFAQGMFGNIDIKGNTSAKIEWYLSPSGTASAEAEDRKLFVGGVAGYMSVDKPAQNIRSAANVTAQTNINIKVGTGTNKGNYRHYIGGAFGYAGIVSKVQNSGSVKYITNGFDHQHYLGGLAGKTSRVEDSSFTGDIVFVNDEAATSLDYTSTIGGIAGILGTEESSVPAKLVYAIDGCYVNADIALDYYKHYAGGLVGSTAGFSKVVDCYLVNNYVNVALTVNNGQTNKYYPHLYWGGVLGSINKNANNYIINNSIRTDYLFDDWAYTTGDRFILGGISYDASADYPARIVNNFVSGGPVDPAHKSKIVPQATRGAYVYETYWNSDVYGKKTGALYLDASSKPYHYNAMKMPVTALNQSVLGLLRYNAGYDGGVLSANIPANKGTASIEYNNWKEITDKDGNLVPVPVSRIDAY